MVLPSLLNEYSTAMGLDLITCLTTKPVDSRFRRVLVSIRCEMFPQMTAQFPVAMSPLLKRKQDLGRPSGDKNRGRLFRPGDVALFAPHKTNLRPNSEMVTNVAGFEWTR